MIETEGTIKPSYIPFRLVNELLKPHLFTPKPMHALADRKCHCSDDTLLPSKFYHSIFKKII